LKLEPNRWNWLVLVKYEDNQPKKALIKVVRKEEKNATITLNVLFQPSFTQDATINATLPTVFDPTGVSFLHSPKLTLKEESQNNEWKLEPIGQTSNNDGLVKSIMLNGLGLLPERPKIIHTYS